MKSNIQKWDISMMSKNVVYVKLAFYSNWSVVVFIALLTICFITFYCSIFLIILAGLPKEVDKKQTKRQLLLLLLLETYTRKTTYVHMFTIHHTHTSNDYIIWNIFCYHRSSTYHNTITFLSTRNRQG